MITTLDYQLKKRIHSSECTICGEVIEKNSFLIELTIPLGDDDCVYEYDYCIKCGVDMIKNDIKTIKKTTGKLYRILNLINKIKQQ